MKKRLPVRPAIEDHEDIAAYLERCARANHLTVSAMTGYHRHAKVWEEPPTQLVEYVAEQTDTPRSRLREATLSGSFPGAALNRARTGRRHSGQPATCCKCKVDTVAARLHMVVLCPICGTLLVDHQAPDPDAAPAVHLVQSEVLAALGAAPMSAEARDRLQRFESLMTAQESAIWSNWPPLLVGESQEARDRVTRFERWAIEPGRLTVRPPLVTATLMALTWQHSKDPLTTRDRLDRLTLMSQTPLTPHRQLPNTLPPADATRHLTRLIAENGLRWEHVPTMFRLPAEPIVLPAHLQTVRTAEAVAMATLVRQISRTSTRDIRRLVADQGHVVNARIVRIASWMLDDPHSLRRFAAHVLRLREEELIDLQRLRRELRNVKSVPTRVVTSLPCPSRNDPKAREVAAAWVWLDATRGRSAGGPHPVMSGHALRYFDRNLNPEGRLILRQWWHERTREITEDVHERRAEERDLRAG